MLNKLLDNRYRIKKIIGEGGMACVYLAFDERLGRNVAVKVLHSHLCQDEEIRQRFNLEAKVLSGTEHPNIINIYDFSGIDSRQLWIVTEILKGVNLAQYVQRFTSRRLHHCIAGLIVAEVLKALDHAHEKGIIHRDIKPENVMVLDSGQIKIMDFGISKNIHTNEMTRPGSFMGSPSYMSPEQIHGKDIDLRSDLYSVSVLFYEIVTGTLPFIGEGTPDVINKILVGKYIKPSQFVPALPAEINKIIIKGLSSKPEKRFGSAYQYLARLKQFLQQHGFDESHIELERFFRDPQKFVTRLNMVDKTIVNDHKNLAGDEQASGQAYTAMGGAQTESPADRTRKLSPGMMENMIRSSSVIAPTKTRREFSAPAPIARPVVPPRVPPLPQAARPAMSRRETQAVHRFAFTRPPKAISPLQLLMGAGMVGLVALLIFWTVFLVILSIEQRYPAAAQEPTHANHRSVSSIKPVPTTSPSPAATALAVQAPTTTGTTSSTANSPVVQPPLPTPTPLPVLPQGTPVPVKKAHGTTKTGKPIVKPLPDAHDPVKNPAQDTKVAKTGRPAHASADAGESSSTPATGLTLGDGTGPVVTSQQEKTPAVPKTGHLMIICDPPGDVSLDQKHVGMTSQPPFVDEGAEIAAGTHSLRIVRQGFLDILREVKVPAGESVKLELKLQRKSVTVPLILRSSHIPFKVTVRGIDPIVKEQKYVFNKKTNEILLVEGKYQIVVEYGTKTIERTVIVSAANAMTFNAEFSGTP